MHQLPSNRHWQPPCHSRPWCTRSLCRVWVGNRYPIWSVLVLSIQHTSSPKLRKTIWVVGLLFTTYFLVLSFASRETGHAIEPVVNQRRKWPDLRNNIRLCDSGGKRRGRKTNCVDDVIIKRLLCVLHFSLFQKKKMEKREKKKTRLRVLTCLIGWQQKPLGVCRYVFFFSSSFSFLPSEIWRHLSSLCNLLTRPDGFILIPDAATQVYK